jgi:hypothetical protein
VIRPAARNEIVRDTELFAWLRDHKPIFAVLREIAKEKVGTIQALRIGIGKGLGEIVAVELAYLAAREHTPVTTLLTEPHNQRGRRACLRVTERIPENPRGVNVVTICLGRSISGRGLDIAQRLLSGRWCVS